MQKNMSGEEGTLPRFACTPWRQCNCRHELNDNITDVDELKNHLPLDREEEEILRRAVKNHPMNIPRYYLSPVNLCNLDHPIRKLCIPPADELIVAG